MRCLTGTSYEPMTYLLLLWKPCLLLFDRLGGSFDTGVCSWCMYARKMMRATAYCFRDEERSTQQKQETKAKKGK
jgi:hypothetical protein